MSVLAHVLVMIVALVGLIVVTVPLVVHAQLVAPARHAGLPFLAAEPQHAEFIADTSDASPTSDTLLGLDMLFCSARRAVARLR